MYISILSPKQQKLLKELKFIEKYGFYLGGGTALALQIGHRTSLDFDFYTEKKFDNNKLLRQLEKKFKKIIPLVQDEDTLIVKINNIIVSFFRYPYQLINPLLKEKNFPAIASIEDISAMKMIAITQRGKMRDFIDVYFLIKKIGLEQIIKFTKKKFPIFNIYLGLQSLTYFKDAEEDLEKDRFKLFEKISWSDIKKFLIREVNKFKKQNLNYGKKK